MACFRLLHDDDDDDEKSDRCYLSTVIGKNQIEIRFNDGEWRFGSHRRFDSIQALRFSSGSSV